MVNSEQCRELKKRVVKRADPGLDTEDAGLYEIIDEVICEYSGSVYVSLADKLQLRKKLFASIRGYDAIQELVDDETVTEIMVNGPDKIFYERDGHLYQYDEVFESREKLEDVVQKIAAGCNRVVNEASPIADARLQDGSRVSLVLYPIALDGPVITIRKFPHEVMTMEKLIALGALNEEAADFLRTVIKAGFNLLISGGTGSGKTTFLNALSQLIPGDERIITIEDSAELQLKSTPNLVTLESRAANVEGRNEISIRDLIKASLRMRPNRIIVGEVRDAACIDMLQAMNTGHSGLSTAHANSARDLLSRMETMCLLGGGEVPLPAVRRQIASAVDIIVQLSRFRDKSRKVTEITEVSGYENGEIILNPLFRFEEESEHDGKVFGHLWSTGNRLVRTEKLAAAGLQSLYTDQ